MKKEQTECSETSAYKIQTPGNYPKESIQHREHGESLKLRIQRAFLNKVCVRSRVCACSVRDMGKCVDTAGLLRTLRKKADVA